MTAAGLWEKYTLEEQLGLCTPDFDTWGCHGLNYPEESALVLEFLLI